MFIEPAAEAIDRGMRETPLQILRNTGDMGEIVILAVPFREARENPENLAISLRAENSIRGCKTLLIKTGISLATRATVVGEQALFKVRGNVAARILKQGNEIIGARPAQGILEIYDADATDSLSLGQP